MLKVCQFDEDSVTTCKFIKFMKIHCNDENSSPWWKFNAVMKMLRYDESSSLIIDHNKAVC